MPAERGGRKVRHSRVLVIDADVLRAAGSVDAVHPVASQCRDILQTILEVCHRAFLTAELRAEWKGHASRFAQIWLRSMHSRRKIVDRVGVGGTAFDAEVRRAPYLTESEKAAMQKDRHLVEAATACDKIVLSMDNRTGEILRKIAPWAGGLAGHLWINPAKDFDPLKAWLTETGQPNPEWRLPAKARTPKPTRKKPHA